MSFAILGTMAIAPVAMAVPATAAPTPIIKISTVKKTLKANDQNPFGNGAENQNYKYADSIKTFAFKVYGAPANTKVVVKKWNWSKSIWQTYKTYSPSSTGSGYLNYKISTPKSAEGKTEVFMAHIPATATTNEWNGKHTYVGTTSRVNINFSKTTTPYSGVKTVNASRTSAQLPNRTWSGVSKEAGNIYIQELQKGKWVNVIKVTKKKASNGSWSLSYGMPVRKAGTTSSYRMYHYANSYAKAWTGATEKVHYKASATDFYERSGALWAGIQKRWTVNMSDTMTHVQVKNGEGRTVYLQKYNPKNKKWYNISSTKLNYKNYASGKITVPKVKTQGNMTYRAHIPANSYYKADTSQSFSVKYEDPRKYTGFRKNVYSHIKKYCPNIVIEGANKNGKWDGIAYWGQQRIKVVYGLSSGRFKKVSLHECAHTIQALTYKDDYNALTKAADKVYGKGKGIEHMADCMAFRMGADVRYYSYTNNCKGARGTAAAKVLAGKRL